MTAEQYEQQNKGMVSLTDDTVRMLAGGITANGKDRNGRYYTRVMPGLGIAPWLQRTMGLRIREAQSVRKADLRRSAWTEPGIRAPVLAGQRERPGAGVSSTARPETSGTSPCPTWRWDMVVKLPGWPALPWPKRNCRGSTACTAANRFRPHTGPAKPGRGWPGRPPGRPAPGPISQGGSQGTGAPARTARRPAARAPAFPPAGAGTEVAPGPSRKPPPAAPSGSAGPAPKTRRGKAKFTPLTARGDGGGTGPATTSQRRSAARERRLRASTTPP